ncbi:bifunctional diguanylate cyclase/phosphodiesterase [Methylomonas koyamae]|uniref:bifunctional diguanylate cyclase/phosphodiesterase n=1 Tax=Methylomonas koyamae TaxID=702114 RepID=UPI002873B643|nr:EAL domain-containing protein [Methylomonas koyamae]WNB77473.1 EAL domain-containing protein [Methylomonas koyamae]
MLNDGLSAANAEFCTLTGEEQEKILRLQQSILESVTHGDSYLDVIRQVCKLEEQLLPNSVGSVMLLDSSGELLNVLAAPSVPPEGISQLNGLRPGPGGGSCGNVIYTQQPQFVSNTFTDPRWCNLRHLAYNFNLCSCWSVPVYSRQRKVIGTFALSSFEHRSPSPFHLRLLEIGASIISIMLDRNRSQETLRLFEQVFEGAEEGIMITDADARILSVNKTFTKILGYTQDELRGNTPRVFSSGQHGADFYRAMWKQIEAKRHWHGEIWNRRKNGEIFPEWLSISAVYDQSEQLTHYIGIFSDISELKNAEEQIQYLSTHDILTGLPNQTAFKNRLQQAIALAANRPGKVAVLSLDLDNFKLLNDSLGLHAGDELLRRVATVLKSCIADTDSLCRIGSDEFLLALPGCNDTETISTVVDSIIEKVRQPIRIAEQTLSLSCSVGIAVYPDDGSHYDSLVMRASEARRKAKKDGGNGYRYCTEQLNSNSFEFLRLAHELRDAVSLEQFVLHFQPQIDLASGQLVGAEALVRWSHPRDGLVYPGRFIDIAEQTGLVAELGNWVLREACTQAAVWRTLGFGPIVTAVNVSALQLRRGDMVGVVENVLRQTGLPPHCLELELTESILIENVEQTLAQLNQLKQLGIKLAIDDFGTGYSSLAYLNKFNVDRLKIDRSFVGQIGNPANDAIIHAIVQMGHALGQRVIAEGVETAAMRAHLLDCHCDEAQGYLFAKPLPAAEFAKLLAGYRQEFDRQPDPT